MKSIHIIDKLILENGTLCAKGPKGQMQLVHLRQGDMDGACVVYSLMMAMITCGIIKRKDAEGLYRKIDGRTSLARLLKKLTLYTSDKQMASEGLVRNGLFLDYVDDVIDHNCSKIMRSIYSDAINDIDGIVQHLKDNDPVIIGTCFRKNSGGHALLAIGFEIVDDVVTKLLCLDPAYDLSECNYWNSIIHVNSNTGNLYKHIYMPASKDVVIDETISVLKP